VDLLRAEGADAVVEHALVGHADDAMRRRYSTVRGGEAEAAVGRVLRRVEGSAGADSGADSKAKKG
jgi:hypothetical protein